MSTGVGAQHLAEGGDDQEPLCRGDGPGAVRADPAPPTHSRESGKPIICVYLPYTLHVIGFTAVAG